MISFRNEKVINGKVKCLFGSCKITHLKMSKLAVVYQRFNNCLSDSSLLLTVKTCGYFGQSQIEVVKNKLTRLSFHL